MQQELYIEILRIIGFIVPMYAANSLAMLLGGGKPLDLNTKFIDGRPLFGRGKTIKGCIAGILAGIIFGLFFYLIYPMQNYLLFVLSSSIGAIAGDIAGSFIKRRFGLKRGSPVPLLDQLDFVAGALIFGSSFMVPTIKELAVIVVVTLVAHKLGNIIAFLFKIKKVPW
ncbi:MAG: CDP-2,3-bis-(O-geranylgeranyl)-sn-glycerol synthase [Candidatus Diapherotrites archaeon]|nr:CDP-2,3-bis-(O-geranylgeranyl)-sn-glycerol synthase [Candidatus Diapherotrites archaeon]